MLKFWIAETPVVAIALTCTAPHPACIVGVKLTVPFASETSIVENRDTKFGVAGRQTPLDGLQSAGPGRRNTVPLIATGTFDTAMAGVEESVTRNTNG
jgi:hypothetical protein